MQFFFQEVKRNPSIKQQQFVYTSVCEIGSVVNCSHCDCLNSSQCNVQCE